MLLYIIYIYVRDVLRMLMVLFMFMFIFVLLIVYTLFNILD